MDAVYISRDNIICLEFRIDNVATSLSTITKIDLYIEDLELTISNSVSDAFPLKWVHDPIQTGVVKLQIGRTTGLSAGLYNAKFYIYSANYTHGFYWCTIQLLIDI